MTIDNIINKYPRRFALMVGLLSFLLYLSTTPKVNVGYGDSDEFLAVSQSGGIAHPPGYPLYVTLLDAAIRLPISGTTPTQRAHLVSGLSAALALALSTLTLLELTNKFKRTSSQKFFAVTTTLLTVATAKLYWTYAQLAEKYIFTSLWFSLIIYLSLRLLHSKKISLQQIFFLCLSYGLMINHHQSTVFLLPYVAYLFFKTKAYRSVKMLIMGVIGLLLGFGSPLLLLVLRANPGQVVSWYMAPGMKGILAFITREDFRGELYYTNTISSGYIPTSLSLNQIVMGSWHYLLVMLESFSFWIILPILVAGLKLWKKDRNTLIAISLPLLLMGFGLASFLKWPQDLGSQATTVRFYIPSIIAFAPFICLGLFELYDRLMVSAKVLGFKGNLGVSLGVISLLFLSPLLS